MCKMSEKNQVIRFVEELHETRTKRTYKSTYEALGISKDTFRRAFREPAGAEEHTNYELDTVLHFIDLFRDVMNPFEALLFTRWCGLGLRAIPYLRTLYPSRKLMAAYHTYFLEVAEDFDWFEEATREHIAGKMSVLEADPLTIAADGAFAAFSMQAEHQSLQVIQQNNDQTRDSIGHQIDQIYASVRHGHLHDMEPKLQNLLARVNQTQSLYRYKSTVHSAYGIYHMKRGDYAAAQLQYKRALGYAHGIERAVILANLGSAAFYDGRFRYANAYYLQSYDLAKKANALLIQAFTTTSLGTVSAERGRYATAEQHYKQAHKLALDIKHQERLAYVYMNRGALAYYNGHSAFAERLYTEALHHAESLDHTELIGQTHWYLGVLMGSVGEPQIRQKHFDFAREIAEHDDLIWQVVGTSVEDGRYLVLDRQWVKASQHLLTALETAIYHRQSDHVLRALVYLCISLAQHCSGTPYVNARSLLKLLKQCIPALILQQLPGLLQKPELDRIMHIMRHGKAVAPADYGEVIQQALLMVWRG